MKLLCLSDIHGEQAGLRDILPGAADGVDAVVLGGDLTHLGGYAEAEALLAPLLSIGVPLLAVAGNMDREGVRRYIAEKRIDIHGRGVLLGRVGFMGLGGGTPSAFHSPWELTDAEARPLLAAGLAQIAQAEFKVLVSHAPPRETKVDRSLSGLHVGSEPVRELILGGAVDLCICGHIHEAAGEDTLGDTPCVNLGPFKNGSYALLVIEGDRTKVFWRKR